MHIRVAGLILMCVIVASANSPAQTGIGLRSDVEGYWTNGTATPLERPVQYKDRFTLTPSEVTEFERGSLARLIESLPEEDRFAADLNDIYLETSSLKMLRGGRTSLIVDPPNGQLPPRVPAAAARAAAMPKHGYDDPETLGVTERCIAGNDGGASQLAAPIVPNMFGLNYYQIVQTPTHVLLHSEVMHETRIIRIGGTHTMPRHVGEWLGDSIGHWEGDALVVDTTNFNGKLHFRGSSDRMHVVERFRRVDDRTLAYRATVEDPDTWTAPWTIEYPFTATSEPIVEFACHEGNYSVENALRGHRAEERQKK